MKAREDESGKSTEKGKVTGEKFAGMLRPRVPRGLQAKSFGLGLSLGLTFSGLGLDLGLMASGLGLIHIGLVASNRPIYSAHDIN